MKKNRVYNIMITAIVSICFLLTSCSAALLAHNQNENRQNTEISQNQYTNYKTIPPSHHNPYQERATTILQDYNHQGDPNPFSIEQSLNQEFVPGELIVKFKEETQITITTSNNGIIQIGTLSFDRLNTQHQVTKMEKIFDVNDNVPRLSQYYKLTLDTESDIQQARQEYAENPLVEYAEPNYLRTFDSPPNDPYYSSSGSWEQSSPDLYGLQTINAEDAWDITQGSHNVVVAVIDSGVDYTHEDIQGNMWINLDEIPDNGVDDDLDGFIDNIYGADFCNDGIFDVDGDNPMDVFGHGTHCAGIIGAMGNNDQGITGVNWQVQIMGIRTDLVDTLLAEAIRWATNNSADVISMSWGGWEDSQLLHDALMYAYSQGVVLVAAAGNYNENYPIYPAGYSEVLGVAATDWNDMKAWFSNYGSWVNVCAPGEDILSLKANNTDMYYSPYRPTGYYGGEHFVPPFDDDAKYYRSSGTSMACPYVAGLAALLCSLAPGYSNERIMDQIISTADNIDAVNPGYEGLLGGGRINAFRALQVFQHNIVLRPLNVDGQVKSHDSVSVETTLVNHGHAPETNIQVRFFVDGVETAQRTISFMEQGTTQTIRFSWQTPSVGLFNLTIAVRTPDGSEEYLDDNMKSTVVRVGVWNTNTDQLFDTIQQAINNPNTEDGHRILIPVGVFTENILIPKNITLRGYSQEKTRIKGNILAPSIKTANQYTIRILNTNEVIISDLTILEGTQGILIQSSTQTTLHDITVEKLTGTAVTLVESEQCIITDTIIQNNKYGIQLAQNSNHVFITRNTIRHNTYGITLKADCTFNHISENDFSNTVNAIDTGTNNAWNTIYNGLAHGGNYWNDYTGEDLFSGPEQTIPGPDGIGDQPYHIQGGTSQDYYPTLYQKTKHILNLNTHKNFSTIQEAIDDPTTLNGHTIYVRSNTYNGNILIDKTLSLIGEEKNTTILRGTRVGDVIQITANQVTLTGFEIRDSGTSFYPYHDEDDAGISIRSNNNSISGNTLIFTTFGIINYEGTNQLITQNTFKNIFLLGIYAYSTKLTIQENTFDVIHFNAVSIYESINTTISNNTFIRIGTGIYLDYPLGGCTLSHNMITNSSFATAIAVYGGPCGTISDNTLKNLGYGIAVDTSNNNTVSRNTVENMRKDGIGLFGSKGNIISDNICIHNGYGFDLGGCGIVIEPDFWQITISENNTIIGNVMTENRNEGLLIWGGTPPSRNNVIKNNTCAYNNFHGIDLNFVNNSVIQGNILNSNGYVGLSLIFSGSNEIKENTIMSHDQGVYTTYSSKNRFSHNNFISNLQSAYDEGVNSWDNGYPSGGNYWDDFEKHAGPIYDDYQGEYQNILGMDGIIDLGPPEGGLNPYPVFPQGTTNQDRYPLLNPWI
ncbi:MAG: S8 family serine peptidase [Methanobacteriota archaeon]